MLFKYIQYIKRKLKRMTLIMSQENLQQEKQYVINDQNNAEHGEGNENDSSIKFETKVIKSNLCDYSDSYIIITGDITPAVGNVNTNVALSFTFTKMNDEYSDIAENLGIPLPMYNLIKYSNNY